MKSCSSISVLVSFIIALLLQEYGCPNVYSQMFKEIEITTTPPPPPEVKMDAQIFNRKYKDDLPKVFQLYTSMSYYIDNFDSDQFERIEDEIGKMTNEEIIIKVDKLFKSLLPETAYKYMNQIMEISSKTEDPWLSALTRENLASYLSYFLKTEADNFPSYIEKLSDEIKGKEEKDIKKILRKKNIELRKRKYFHNGLLIEKANRNSTLTQNFKMDEQSHAHRKNNSTFAQGVKMDAQTFINKYQNDVEKVIEIFNTMALYMENLEYSEFSAIVNKIGKLSNSEIVMKINELLKSLLQESGFEFIDQIMEISSKTKDELLSMKTREHLTSYLSFFLKSEADNFPSYVNNLLDEMKGKSDKNVRRILRRSNQKLRKNNYFCKETAYF